MGSEMTGNVSLYPSNSMWWLPSVGQAPFSAQLDKKTKVSSLVRPIDYREVCQLPNIWESSRYLTVTDCRLNSSILQGYTLWDFLFFPPFIFISWRLITLQYCSGFCHTLTWISHRFTCVPHPVPPSHLPLHPIPLDLPSAPGPSTCLMHPTWAGDLFHPR